MIRKLILFAAVLFSPLIVWAQGPPADCSVYGYCAGLGAPTGACRPGAMYTQIDSAGTSYTCNGLPPAWHLSSGGGIPTLGVNTAVATQANGQITNLPEIETTTSGGVTSIYCQEDRSNGIFDPRCATYAGGVNGTTPAAAWQATLNAAACWTVINGLNGGTVVRSATVKMPPGIFAVGTANAPTLMGGPGVVYEGSPGGNALSPINLGGTTFLETYVHAPIFQIANPFYMPCAGDVAVNVTSISISGNVATVSAPKSFTAGAIGSFSGVTAGALWFLNQQNSAYTITSATSNSFQFAVAHADVAATAQSGAIFQQVHVDAVSGGAYGNIAVEGCGERSCSSIPGDPNSPGETGNETGISITATHVSKVGALSAAYTRGEGIAIEGVDVITQGPFITQSTATYWANPDAGDAGAAVGYHSQIDLGALDGQFWNVETYGPQLDPNATTLGHVCEVALYGGNTSLNGVFVNIGQMGICTNGSGQRINNFRVDGVRGPSIQDSGSQNNWGSGYTDGYCLSAAFRFKPGFDPTGPGTCVGIDARGSGVSTFMNINMVRNFFDGETFQGTGDINSLSHAQYIGVHSNDTGAEPAYDRTYDGIGGNSVGAGTMLLPFDAPAESGKGVGLTGATPSVLGHRHLEMMNTSPTNITDLTDATLQTDYRIALDSTNDVLVSTANGGNFLTCDGYNVVGPALVDFTAIQTKLSFLGGNLFQAMCPGVNKNFLQVNAPGNTLPATDALSSVNVFGSAAVNPLTALPNGTFTVAGSASSFTYSWVTEVYAGGGKQTNTPQSTQYTPVAVSPSQNVYFHQAIPLDWTRYKIILQSTTDPSFTPGVYYDVTAPSALPQPAIADINLPLTVLTPISTTILPSTSFGVNMTGTFTFDPSNIPAHANSPCMPGQIKMDVTGGYEYYCVAEDTWQRAPLTFATF